MGTLLTPARDIRNLVTWCGADGVAADPERSLQDLWFQRGYLQGEVAAGQAMPSPSHALRSPFTGGFHLIAA